MRYIITCLVGCGVLIFGCASQRYVWNVYPCTDHNDSFSKITHAKQGEIVLPLETSVKFPSNFFDSLIVGPNDNQLRSVKCKIKGETYVITKSKEIDSLSLFNEEVYVFNLNKGEYFDEHNYFKLFYTKTLGLVSVHRVEYDNPYACERANLNRSKVASQETVLPHLDNILFYRK